MMDLTKVKVFVNVSSRRSPEWGMYINITNAMRYASQRGLAIEFNVTLGETLICRSRNRALSKFLESDCTHMLTIDDDVELPESAFVDLLMAGKDLIGGVYRLKDPKAAQVAVRIPNKANWPFILKTGVVSAAHYLSSGCMMFTREMLLKMIEHYQDLCYHENLTNEPRWALYQPYIYTHTSGVREYLSEDWAFCQRAAEIGFPAFVHGKVQCGHWGLVKFDFQYPENFMEKLIQVGDDGKLIMVNEELEDRTI